jgi:hypothetical protein
VAGDAPDPVEPFRVSRCCGVSASDRTRRGGAQPFRQAAVVWRERSRGRVMRRPGPWPPRQRLTAPLQTLPALRSRCATRPNAVARDCAPPTVADARGAPQRSTNPATTGCPAARRACAPFASIAIRTSLGSTKLATRLLKATSSPPPPKNNTPVTFLTHTHAARRRVHSLRSITGVWGGAPAETTLSSLLPNHSGRRRDGTGLLEGAFLRQARRLTDYPSRRGRAPGRDGPLR